MEHAPCGAADAAESRIVQIEVAEIIDRLDLQMQQVGRLLMDGKSTAAVAEELGYGWHRAHRIEAGIRERFESAGLNPTSFG